MPRVFFLTGKVVREDGELIPIGALVESNCSGRVKTVATVNANGSFSFQFGGFNEASDILPQASDDSPFSTGNPFGNPNERQLDPFSPASMTSSFGMNGCELRVRLSGYRSSAVILQGPFDIGPVDVGTILLSPTSRVPGTTVSITNLRAPKAAQKALERAQKALQKSNLAEGEKDLNMAVTLYPEYAAAWLALGRLYQRQERNEEARKAYSAAVAADDKYVSSYIGLAQLAGLERKWQEVADLTDRALALDPLDLPEGYYYNSLAYYNLNKLDPAERSAWKAQRLDGFHRFPLVHLLLANLLEKKQDAAGAADQLQKYLKFAPDAKDAEQARVRLEALRKASKLLADKQAARP
jgi:tetratricopeptide (TPR) repeat protein